MNIGILLIIIVGGIVGVFSIVYMTVSLIAMLVYKIYRSIKYKVSLYD